MLRDEFAILNSYARKDSRPHINILNFYLKKMRKKSKQKQAVKEKIKVRTEVNEKENRDVVEKINENKSWLFKKIFKNAKRTPRAR